MKASKFISLAIALPFLLSTLSAEIDETITVGDYEYEITFSKYDADHHSIRETALGDWIDRDASQKQLDEMKPQGFYPIITEVRSQHYKRRIYAEKKASYTVRTGRLFSQFASYHKQYFSKGYELLSLTYFIDEFDQKWYNATWVSLTHFEECKQDLEKYGISPAKVVMYKLIPESS